MKKKLLSTLSLIAVAFLATAAYKLRIDENGFVGIGVQIPSTKLEVSGGVTLANLGSGETPKAGTIKFDGGDFMGFDGTNWKSLTVGNSEPATIVSGENAERRAGSIRWSGDEFEGYDGENWIPFKMNATWEDGYLSLNASSLGFDLSIQEKITYEGLDFEVKGVKFLSLATDQQYLVKAMVPEGSGIPMVLVSTGSDDMDAFSSTNTKRMSFGDLDGFYILSESAMIMEMKLPNFYTKMLNYSQVATVYLNLGQGNWATMTVMTPDNWTINMSINDSSDTREMVDVVPPKAERDELERKIRTIAESVKVTKISKAWVVLPGQESEENKAGDTFTVPDLSLEMLWVTPGTFDMGSPTSEAGRNSNETQHQVTLTNGFWLGKHEVTQAQWEQVMGSNPSNFKGANRPVESVSWNDAVEFCEKLTELERAAGRLSAGMTYQLPTEAQWEYACRAGTTTAYSWGNSITASNANYSSSGIGQTRDGDQYAANAWGFHDMHGNVWEWCADWYGDYPTGAARDPVGPADGSLRVGRGGSWLGTANYARSAIRIGLEPAGSGNSLGFRPCLRPASK